MCIQTDWVKNLDFSAMTLPNGKTNGSFLGTVVVLFMFETQHKETKCKKKLQY